METVRWTASSCASPPYTAEELTAQVQALCDAGAEGAAICADADAYTEGVNAFMAEARQDPSRLSAEYPALQVMPEDWISEDIVAIASLVGGIFGRGGGGEIANGRFLAQLQAEHGQAEGAAVFADFRSANDPEAPPTTGRAFPYNNHTTIDPASTAILDLDTVDATMAAMAPPSMVADGPFGPIDLRGLADPVRMSNADPVRMSNAILATGDVTDGGVPIAVFGPQTGYFTPQLLVEMGIFGPGIAARGAAFAGTNLFIQLGRGTNYAWSATSAGGDNVD
jgi:acyl-homoserine lactone acylase PvdQ